MADDTGGQQPPFPRNITVRNLTASQTEMAEVNVRRLNVNTGEDRGGETDLLTEIRNATDEQTRTLTGEIQDLQNATTEVTRQLRLNRGQDQSQLSEAITVLKEIRREIKSGGGGSTPTPSEKDSSKRDEFNDKLISAMTDLGRAMETAALRIETVGDGGGGGGGGDGDGGGGGGGQGSGFAGIRSTERAIRNFRDITENARITDFFDPDKFKRASDAFSNMSRKIELNESAVGALSQKYWNFIDSGVLTQLQENFDTINSKLQNFGRSMTDMSNVTEYASQKFNTYMDLNATGLGTFYDAMIGDLVPAILESRDNLVSTFETVRTAISENLINPIGILGTSMDEVARTFRTTRNQIMDLGFDFYDRMGFQEANESMVALLDIQRTADVRTRIEQSNTQRQMMDQLRFLDLIGTNTGKTVEEIIKSTQEDRRSLAQLEAAGIITAGQRQGFSQLNEYLRGRGMNTMAEQLLGVARQGGSVEAFLAQNADMTRSLAATGNVDTFRALASLANTGGGMGDESFVRAIMGVARNFQSTPFLGVAGGQVISTEAQQMIGEVGRLSDELVRQREADESTIGGLVRWAGDFFANVIPSATAGMVMALGVNTAAIIANTVALYRTRAGGFLSGRGEGGAGGYLHRGGNRRPMPRAKGVFAPGARFGGTRATSPYPQAGAMRRMGGMAKTAGKSLLKKIPVIGLAAGLLFGAQSAMAGDFIGAGGEILSGAASMVPGLGTAASVGIDSMLAARSMGAFDGTAMGMPGGPDLSMASAATPDGTGSIATATAPPSVQTGMNAAVDRNTKLLEDIKSLMEDSNDINSDVRRYTQRIGTTNLGVAGTIVGAMQEGFSMFSGDSQS